MIQEIIETITLDGLDAAGNLERWRGLVQQFALSASRFEVHCWEDEGEAIVLALDHGEEKAADWPHGRVFAGAVTPAFVQTLLTQPLPGEGAAVPRLTPFFSIFFDNGFSSEHYGTEVHITTEEDDP